MVAAGEPFPLCLFPVAFGVQVLRLPWPLASVAAGLVRVVGAGHLPHFGTRSSMA